MKHRALAIAHSALRLLAAAALALLAPANGAAHAAPPEAPSGQAASGFEVVVNQVDLSNYPELKLYVTVTGSGGAPVLGIPETAFSVREDAAAMDVTSVANVEEQPQGSPMKMVLALDTSSSVQGRAIEDITAAARDFVVGLNPRDKIAQIAFNDQVREVHPFTNNTNVMTQTIAGLAAGGGTALYEAIYRSAELVDEQEGRRAFVLLTDGWNDTSLPRTLDDAAARAVEAQAPGYVLGFGSANDAALQRIADETNGRYLRKPSSADVTALFTELTGLLSSQYVVTYDTEVVADSKSHDFTVTVAHGGRTASGTKSVLITPADIPTPSASGTATGTATRTPTPIRNGGEVLPPEPIDAGFSRWTIPALLGLLALAVVFMAMRPKDRKNGSGTGGTDSEPNEGTPTPQPPNTPVPIAYHDYGGAKPHDTIVSRPVGAAAGWLIGLNDEVANRRFPLTAAGRGETTFGREPDNTHTIVGGGTVSRNHALVKFEHDHFVIRDLGARNPTKVNGRAIARQALKDGDRIAIGRLEFEFKMGEGGAGRQGKGGSQ